MSSNNLEPLVEVRKITDISKKKALVKLKNFLILNAIDESSECIQTRSIGAVSEEVLEKIEHVTKAIETEKVLCKPVPPVTDTDEVQLSVENIRDISKEKKKKKKKRDSNASSTKEKKRKKVRTE